MKPLSDKRVLITGSSRGIGRAIALALAKDGAEIVVHYANQVEKADEVRALIESIGGKAQIIQGNLSTPDSAQNIMQKVGEIDILVLNASVQIRRPWLEISQDEAISQLQCNFVSSLRLLQLAVPAMIKKHWGRVVAIGSVQERKPNADMLVYSASKAAQTNMILSLAGQLASDGITVNSVAPGVIYTDRNLEALGNETYASKVKAAIPMGFYGLPEDCTGAVRLLCSEEGRYITGQSIYVDGGKSL